MGKLSIPMPPFGALFDAPPREYDRTNARFIPEPGPGRGQLHVSGRHSLRSLLSAAVNWMPQAGALGKAAWQARHAASGCTAPSGALGVLVRLRRALAAGQRF